MTSNRYGTYPVLGWGHPAQVACTAMAWQSHGGDNGEEDKPAARTAARRNARPWPWHATPLRARLAYRQPSAARPVAMVVAAARVGGASPAAASVSLGW